jgi:membrane-associated phospholipid phosphatase
MAIAFFFMLIQSVFVARNFVWDHLLAAHLRQFPLPHLVFKFFYLITSWANTETVVALLALMLALSTWKRKARFEAALLIMSVAIAALVEWAFKHHFARFRPNGALGNYHLASYSFPSGHAMLSVCFYGLFFYFLARYFPKYQKWILGIALLLALFIGASRVIIGVHFFSDVLGGYLVAVPILCLGIYLYRFRQDLQLK